MGPIRVALVEDEPAFAQAMATVLSHAPGFTCVATCHTLQDATTQLPPLLPDVALVDLDLPDGRGEECILQLRERVPSMKCIVLSKFDHPGRVFDAVVAGAFGYLLKSDGLEQVIAAINAVHSGGGSLSPSVARRALELLRGQAKPASATENALTPKEEEILKLAIQALATGEIAQTLGISKSTVSNHLTSIFAKLHVSKRSDLPGYQKKKP